MTTVQDGQVVSMGYVLRIDGAVIDASAAGQPLEFIQGQGHIIPGLERELYGMQIGESRQVLVAPADGYGEYDLEAFVEIPRRQIPPNVPLQVGLELQLRAPDGSMTPARVDQLEADLVRLDLNHPLAGKHLQFDVEIVALRDATQAELDDGYIHTDDPGHE